MVQLTGTNDADPHAAAAARAATASAASEGVERLSELVEHAPHAPEFPRAALKLDVSIARGLDYYTGTVLETMLDDLPDIGSVCSGGRYDNLAELYTKQELPGIGASLGLDRLLAAMEELGMLPAARTPAQVFIPYFDAARLGDYFQLAAALRAAGIGVEVYPEPEKLGKQLQYADKQRLPRRHRRRRARIRRRRVPGERSRQRQQRNCLPGRRRRRAGGRSPAHLGDLNKIVYKVALGCQRLALSQSGTG